MIRAKTWRYLALTGTDVKDSGGKIDQAGNAKSLRLRLRRLIAFCWQREDVILFCEMFPIFMA
jgi:hypothetical protein